MHDKTFTNLYYYAENPYVVHCLIRLNVATKIQDIDNSFVFDKTKEYIYFFLEYEFELGRFDRLCFRTYNNTSVNTTEWYRTIRSPESDEMNNTHDSEEEIQMVDIPSHL